MKTFIRFLLKTVTTILLLAGGSIASVNAEFSIPSVPLTQLEQTARIAQVTDAFQQSKLFPRNINLLKNVLSQTNYRQEWLKAGLQDRITISERLGTEGTRVLADRLGFKEISGGQNRAIAQGPDWIGFDPKTGKIVVLESKGGTSRLDNYHDSKQGTNTNHIRSAKSVLRSRFSTSHEKITNALIIKFAQNDGIMSAVSRTTHVLGRPDIPKLEGHIDTTNVSKEAWQIERELTLRNPSLKTTFSNAQGLIDSKAMKFPPVQRSAASDRPGFLSLRGVETGVGLVGSGLLVLNAYEQTEVAWASWADSGNRGSALPFLQTGLAATNWAESAALGMNSAGALGSMFGRNQLSGVGQVAGKWFLGFAVVSDGLSAGITSYEYSTGRISQREFYRRSTGTGIRTGFTVVGAIVGGIMGAPAGGIGAGPGAAAGAAIGASVAAPFVYGADKLWEWQYSEFDQKQRDAVDRLVEQHYGL